MNENWNLEARVHFDAGTRYEQGCKALLLPEGVRARVQAASVVPGQHFRLFRFEFLISYFLCIELATETKKAGRLCPACESETGCDFAARGGDRGVMD